MQRPQVFWHLKLYLSSLQKSSLSEAVPYSVFTLHQYEPKPGMSLSLQAGGGGLGAVSYTHLTLPTSTTV